MTRLLLVHVTCKAIVTSSWVLLVSTETVGLFGMGAQDGHLDFHTAPELCHIITLIITYTPCDPVGVHSLAYIHTYIHTCKLYLCDPLVVEHYFTSTETVGLLGTGAQDGHPDFHTAPEVGDPLPLPQFKYSFPSCFPPPLLPPLSDSIFKYSTFYSSCKGRSTPSSPSKCEWLIWIADHNKFYGLLFSVWFCISVVVFHVLL